MSISGQSELCNDLIERVESAFPIEAWKKSYVVVGVSGGPDSVALLRLILAVASRNIEASNSKIVVVHCNHAAREDSKSDEKFVADLADSLGLDYAVVYRTETNGGANSEESMRNFRYQSLIETAHELGARYVLTGHNQDDQVETILFRLFRGTGITGLSGIPELRVVDNVSIVRPMLDISRAEILRLLTEWNQPFVSDASNQDERYSRNLIRHSILPPIEERFGNVRQALIRLSEQADQFSGLLDDLSPTCRQVDVDENSVTIEIVQASNQHQLLIGHALKKIWRTLGYSEQAMTQEKWNLLTNLAVSTSDGVLQLPGHITVVRRGEALRFLRTATNRHR